MSRPAARQASISRRGSPPPPATMPILRRPRRYPPLASFGWQMARLEFGADEGDDVLDRTDTGKSLGGFADPVAQRPFGEKQELIGVAQALDVLAAESRAAACR